MNVLFDHQAFTGHTYGGVARYFYDLMRCFDQRNDVTFDFSLLFSNNEYLKEANFSSHYSYKQLAKYPNVNRVASVLNRLNSIRLLQKGAFDVFHPTYYHRYFLEHLKAKPFVLTFYDATSERYAQQYPELGEGLPDVKRDLLKRADKIIAISEFSKQEILHFFDVDPGRIEVVYLGTTLSDAQPTGLTPLPYPYVLYVGKRPFYKNFDPFFKAMVPVLNRHRDIHLVCAGGGSFNQQELDMFQGAGLADRVHQQGITDQSLLMLYQHARAFVFPSLNEGFGIPVLEAFSGRCPVILSDRSSLPEVAGEAAVYFDPENLESMGAAVEKVVFDDTLRAELVQKGTERLQFFSCEKTASQTLDVYRQLVG